MRLRRARDLSGKLLGSAGLAGWGATGVQAAQSTQAANLRTPSLNYAGCAAASVPSCHSLVNRGEMTRWTPLSRPAGRGGAETTTARTTYRRPGR
ncbi:hypothetical protein PPN31114_03214 [Pandoraea pneumonica]|uniref:Uncharacterized protein n=1 Tax=Pandoraea pneumonica TaxID=2508299 RepID=A0A5E4WHG0_9BURK|nr:hypothetical protein PPN31114_03214 [Pandoraea pneumonica]